MSDDTKKLPIQILNMQIDEPEIKALKAMFILMNKNITGQMNPENQDEYERLQMDLISLKNKMFSSISLEQDGDN